MTAPESIALVRSLEEGAPATVLALHCSEHAARGPFDETVARLHPGEIVERITVPGGAWWLARAADLTEGRIKRIALGGHSPAREAIEAILQSGSVRHVLLIGHQDCAWYRARFPSHTPGGLVREQGADLLRARDEIQRWATARVTVDAWIVATFGTSPFARRLH